MDPSPPTEVDPRFERSVRRWLRAYPRRWRAARADEVLGTLADIAGPGATQLAWRAGLGLFAHGLANRVRTGPPPHQRIGYLFGARVSSRYVAWMADDLASPVPTSRLAWRVLMAAVIAVPWWLRHDRFATWVTGVVLAAIVVDISGDNWRRNEGLRLLLPRAGDSTDGPRWVVGRLPRMRFTARVTWASLAALAAWASASGIVGWFVGSGATSRRTGLTVAAVSLVLGLSAAAVAMWHWRRWAGRGPAQPDRILRAATVRHVLVVAWSAVVVSGWVALEVDSRQSPAVSGIVAAVGLVVLPGAIAAWRWAAGAPDHVAAVDLLWVAVTGRPPISDRRVETAVPAGMAAARVSLIDLIAVDSDRPALG